MDDALLTLIRKHEGFRASAYRDTRGYLTIGYGRLIDGRRGVDFRAEAEFLLADDIRRAEAAVHALFRGADDFAPARITHWYPWPLTLGAAGLNGSVKCLPQLPVIIGKWQQRKR